MTDQLFAGFSNPHSNFTEMPLALIEALPLFKSLAELKVVLYVLRHTWGYREYDEGKRISLDEFEHGRKRRDGSRIDPGVGMVKNSIIDGIDKAIEHGFLTVEIDDKDKARIEKFYSLQMCKSCTPDVQLLNPDVQKLNIGGSEVEHRTEISTLDKDSKIDTKTIATSPHTVQGLPDDEFFIVLPEHQSIIRVPILPSHIPSGHIALQGRIIKSDERYQSFKLVLAAPLPQRKSSLQESAPKEKGSGEKEKVIEPVTLIDYPEPAAPKTQPHVALIEAWHYSIPDDLRPIGKPVIERNCAVAKELKEAGLSPYDVVRFVSVTYSSYRGWAERNHAPAVMTLEHIKKFYPAFKAKESANESRPSAKQYSSGSSGAPGESRTSAIDPAKERELTDWLFGEIDKRASMRALQGNGLLPDRKTG